MQGRGARPCPSTVWHRCACTALSTAMAADCSCTHSHNANLVRPMHMIVLVVPLHGAQVRPRILLELVEARHAAIVQHNGLPRHSEETSDERRLAKARVSNDKKLDVPVLPHLCGFGSA
jgi:hypothetical protein